MWPANVNRGTAISKVNDKFKLLSVRVWLGLGLGRYQNLGR